MKREQTKEVLRDDLHQESAEETSLLVASQWQLIRWKFTRHKVAMAALVILVLFYFVAILAEFFAPYDPYQNDKRYTLAPPTRIHFRDEEGRFHLRPFVYGMERGVDKETLAIFFTEDRSQSFPLKFFVQGAEYKLLGIIPGSLHLVGTAEGGRYFAFGTDYMGRDMLSRIIYASRISLSIGLVGIAISFFIGIILGGVSGYYGGQIDIIIQRVIEFIRSIPSLPLWMALSAALPPYWSITKTYFGIVVILSLVGWTGLARVVRGKFMSVREEDFIMAAQLGGASEAKIIFRHLLPSFYSYIIASLTLSIPGMILGETSLSFIGLGMQAPALSWGVLLKDAQHLEVLAQSVWLLIPGIFVIVSILAFNFVGDGLRDAADPYSTV